MGNFCSFNFFSSVSKFSLRSVSAIFKVHISLFFLKKKKIIYIFFYLQSTWSQVICPTVRDYQLSWGRKYDSGVVWQLNDELRSRFSGLSSYEIALWLILIWEPGKGIYITTCQIPVSRKGILRSMAPDTPTQDHIPAKQKGMASP